MKWEEIVGQTGAKSRLEFHLEGFRAGQPMPSLFFVGPRGFGKTSIATALGLKMKEITKNVRRFYLINSATVMNEKQLVEDVLIAVVQDKDSTILFDEAHMLKEKVSGALLTVTQPTHEHFNTYTYGDMSVDIDLKRNSFMFATTEPHKVSMPLMNRCKRLDLVDYTYDDLIKIIYKNTPDITYEKDLPLQIAQVCRSTARQAVMMSDDILSYLAANNTSSFTFKAWEELKKRLHILPLGLTELELRVLTILKDSRDASLTRVAATMCMTPQSVRQDCELFLLKNNLMEISRGSGRNLTGKGRDYLKALKGS